MQQCNFVLNDQPMSAFSVGGASFPAFSGKTPYINKRANSCLVKLGPIPPGTYYVIDRETGGRFGWLRDLVANKKNWFALYAEDGRIDDWTFCNEVKRGNFRLHPMGERGISEGCITVHRAADFHVIHSLLKRSRQSTVPGADFRAYGKVVVK